MLLSHVPCTEALQPESHAPQEPKANASEAALAAGELDLQAAPRKRAGFAGARYPRSGGPTKRESEALSPTPEADQALELRQRMVRFDPPHGAACERITIESVTRRSGRYRTPRSSEPLVTPVAATNTSSPATRSSVCQDAARGRARRPRACWRSSSSRGQSLPWIPPPTHLSAGRGDHALGRAADPIEQVHPGPGLRSGDRGRDVAVADQVHLRAGLAELADQILVPVALEHDDGDARASTRLSPSRQRSRSPSATR